MDRIVHYWDRDRALADLGLEEAMSEESTTPHLVELTRGVLEAASRRDFDGALAPFAPDAVWDMSLQGMGVFEGHTAIRGFLEDWTGAYEDYEIMTEGGRDLGNGVTFGVFLLRGRLPGSGGWVELRLASVQSWRQGLIERDTFYTDIDEARAAAERLAEERARRCRQRTWRSSAGPSMPGMSVRLRRGAHIPRQRSSGFLVLLQL